MVRYCKNGHSAKRGYKCPVCGDKLFFGCPQCQKEWNDCLCPGWPIYLFVFARPQVWWLLQNGLEWPEEIEGFTDKVQASRGHSAPFESTACIISEIEWRLNQCGKDGRILKHDAKYIERYQDLAQDLKQVLNYCSGWKRKEPYSRWLAHKKEKKCTTKTAT